VRIPAPVAADDETDRCAVCLSESGCEENELVYCDGCGVCVHQVCYGLDSITNDDWLCDPCLAKADKPMCAVCPAPGGAFKQTGEQQWVHIACVLWLPGIGFTNAGNMTGVTPLRHIKKDMCDLECLVCQGTGVNPCLRCHWPHCNAAFHVGCALIKGSGVSMLLYDDDNNSTPKRATCPRHTQDSIATTTTPLRTAETESKAAMPCAETTTMPELTLSNQRQYWMFDEIREKILISHDKVDLEELKKNAPTISRSLEGKAAKRKRQSPKIEFPVGHRDQIRHDLEEVKQTLHTRYGR
jgi:hypothetical protein